MGGSRENAKEEPIPLKWQILQFICNPMFISFPCYSGRRAQEVKVAHFVLSRLKITSFQPPLAPPWALTTRVGRGCAEFPTRSSWLCAEEQHQERAEASASRCSELQGGTTGVGTNSLQSVILNMDMHRKEILQTPLMGGTQSKKPKSNDGKGNWVGIQEGWTCSISSSFSVLSTTTSFSYTSSNPSLKWE